MQHGIEIRNIFKLKHGGKQKCSHQYTSTHAHSTWLGRLYFEHFRDDPYDAFMKLVKIDFCLDISKHHVGEQETLQWGF